MTTTNTKQKAVEVDAEYIRKLRLRTATIYDQSDPPQRLYDVGLLRREGVHYLERTDENHSRWLRLKADASV